MPNPPRAQGKPYSSPPMFEDPRYRKAWVLEPDVRAICTPLLLPRHPLKQLRNELPGVRGPVYWAGMTPAQLAALLDTAPWERDQGHNARPKHRWFLDLADAFPEATFHGFTRDRLQH